MKLLKYFLIIFLLPILSACVGDRYVYDRAEVNRRDNVNSNNGGQVPRYYYRNAPTYGNSYPSQYQQVPGSRFYSNPYDIPPSPYYNTYDYDQYYTPPNYYYGNEGQQQQSDSKVPELRF